MTDGDALERARAFGLYSAEYGHDPHSFFDEFRDTCPVARVDELGGYWLLTRYDDVFAAAQDPATFSSKYITVPRDVGGDELSERPPITLDPPRHAAFRRLLLPAFNPTEAERLAPVMRQIARDKIEGFAAEGHCDASVDYARKIALGVMCALMGVSSDMEAQFFSWAHSIFESGDVDESIAAATELSKYLEEQVVDRSQHPRDDLISRLVQVEVDGERLAKNELIGALTLILIAGLDTVWSVLGNSLVYLANNPAARQQLISDASLLPTAVEEFLRYFAPACLGRVTTKDVTVRDAAIDSDEMVLLAFPAANRDRNVFENPDEVVLNREANRHLAFGVGPHRCLGSSIARLELQVGIEEWLAAIPDFALADPNAVQYTPGQTWGPRSIPVVFPVRS